MLKNFYSPDAGRSRRRFFYSAVSATSAFSLVCVCPSGALAAEEDFNVLGPRTGYSPHLGTLVSEMAWMREAVVRATKGMKQEQLDFLLDAKANRIGALMLHLAAAEKLYQLNTFDSVPVDQLEDADAFKEWKVAMNLGDPARAAIKGHDLDFYLGKLREGREKTLAEFKKRDDTWLFKVDKTWPWGPTDNLCKWFHVCEHESHHSGQIGLLASRAPGAKPENG